MQMQYWSTLLTCKQLIAGNKTLIIISLSFCLFANFLLSSLLKSSEPLLSPSLSDPSRPRSTHLEFNSPSQSVEVSATFTSESSSSNLIFPIRSSNISYSTSSTCIVNIYRLFSTDCPHEVAVGSHCKVWCSDYLSEPSEYACLSTGELAGTRPICYEHLGCWKDQWQHVFQGGQVRVKSVGECAQQSELNTETHTCFAIENKKECYSSRDACEIYDTHGPSEGCKNGRGGRFAMDVYRTIRCLDLECPDGSAATDIDGDGCADLCKKVYPCTVSLGPSYNTTCSSTLQPGDACYVSCREGSLGGGVLLICPADNIHPDAAPSGIPPPCFISLGCWKDKGNTNWWVKDNPRAISGGIGHVESIEECARFARHTALCFAVEYQHECFFSATACDTYNRHGPAEGCVDGRGKPFGMDVYQFVSEFEPCTQHLPATFESNCTGSGTTITAEVGNSCVVWCKGNPGIKRVVTCDAKNILPMAPFDGEYPKCFLDIGCYKPAFPHEVYMKENLNLAKCFSESRARSSRCFGMPFGHSDKRCFDSHDLCDMITSNQLEKETCSTSSLQVYQQTYSIPPCEHQRLGEDLASVVVKKDGLSVYGIVYGQTGFNNKVVDCIFCDTHTLECIKTDSVQVHNKTIRDWVLVIECPLPTKFIPLTDNDDDYIAKLTLSIVDPFRKNFAAGKTPFPVCQNIANTRPLYPVETHFHLAACTWMCCGCGGRYPCESELYRLKEWLELNRWLGVEHIVIYDSSRYPYGAMYDFLQPYIEEGFITYASVPNNGWFGPQYVNQNDCFLRFGRNADWFMLYDVDEFMIPLIDNDDGSRKNIPQMIDYYIDKHGPLHHIDFILSIMHPCKTEGFDLGKELFLSSHRCPLHNPPREQKQIINTSATLYMENHWPTYIDLDSNTIPEEERREIKVNRTTGLMTLHYTARGDGRRKIKNREEFVSWLEPPVRHLERTLGYDRVDLEKLFKVK